MKTIIRCIGLVAMLLPYPLMAAEPQRIDGEAGFGRLARAEGNFVVVADAQPRLHVLARNNAGEWQPVTEIAPDEGEAQDSFGAFIAVDGNRIVAGSPGATVDGIQNAGAVYVFERNGDDSNWRQTARLVAEDPVEDGRFGSGVGVDADRIVVAAQTVTEDEPDGRHRVAYVLEYDAATLTWEQSATLSRESIERFAISVDISGDRVAVGTGEGFVFTYVRTDSGWPLSLPMRPTQTGNGLQVALEGDVLAVAAPNDNIPDRPWSAGQVYIFERDDNAWEHITTFQAPTPVPDGGFGTRLDMNDGIVGAVGNHETSGTLSLIRKDENGEWVRFESLDCCFPEIGRSIAVSAQAVVTGGTDGGPGFVYIHDTASLLPEDDDDDGGGTGSDDDDDPGSGNGGGDDNDGGSDGSGNGDDADDDIADNGTGIADDGGADGNGNGDGNNDGNSGGDDGSDDNAGNDGEAGADGDNVATGSSGGGAFGWWMLLMSSVLLFVRSAGRPPGLRIAGGGGERPAAERPVF